MEPMLERDTETARLAERLVAKIRQTCLFKKKEPAEESNDTARGNVDTEQKN